MECVPSLSAGCRNRGFRFENAWLIEPEFKPFVEQRWDAYGSNQITQKLDQCAEDLQLWSKENCQPIRKEIEKYRRKLVKARTQVCSSNVNYFNNIRKRLDMLLVKDDLFWKQRAKSHWYRDGDLNTKFFHASATTRRAANKITQLEDANGEICSTGEGLKNIAKEYFLDLFQQKDGDRDRVISTIPTTITTEDNESLTSCFMLEEFSDAVFSMNNDKCPGPDGFNPGFYKNFWNICVKDVFDAACGWLDMGYFHQI